MEYTLSEYCTLPSEGKIYKKEVNPQVHLRSMTTEEEMRRLSPTNTPYKTLCDIIDRCMVEPIGISSYDLCLGDYQYLLHRLRVVTYGTEYPSSSICPLCGTLNKVKLDLDEIPVIKYDESINNYTEVTLPISKKVITLKYQTPRDIDDIELEEKEFKSKNAESTINIKYLIALRHIIEAVDGKHYDKTKLDFFLRGLNMRDTNLLYQYATKLTEGIGLDTKIKNKCTNPKCGVDYNTSFRITNEFFGPTI